MINHVIGADVFNKIADTLATMRATQDVTVNEELKKEARSRIFRKGHLLKDLVDGYSSSKKFLNALTLESSEISKGEDINLLSIHASKGLEFKEVYVIDLMDGRFQIVNL